MYKFRGNLGVKLTAMILFVIFTVVMAASGLGIGFAVYSNVYIDNGERLYDGVLADHTYGKLQYAKRAVESAFDTENGIVDDELIPDYFDKGNTNFSFRVLDGNKNVIYESFSVEKTLYTSSLRVPIAGQTKVQLEREFSSYDEVQAFIEQSGGSSEISVRIGSDANGERKYYVTLAGSGSGVRHYDIEGSIDSSLEVKDDIYTAVYLARLLVFNRYNLIWICAGALIMMLILFVFLMCSAGRKSGVAGIYLCWSDRIPFDLVLAALFFLAVMTLYILDFFNGSDIQLAIACVCAAVIWLVILMCNLVSFAARAKEGTWWKNTVIYIVLRFLWKCISKAWSFVLYIFRAIPLMWKFVILWAAYSVCELLVMISTLPHLSSEFLFFWYGAKIVLTLVIAVAIINCKKLFNFGKRIAGGEVGCKADTRFMFGDFKAHAKTLENIGDGITAAVDNKMRSERMKTELITNVSHDIKTPLTSIINYVDLLKKEEIANERAAEYIEVIDRQSARLKKLTEDLVEASKAQTGSITVQAEPVDIGVLLSQGFGEYEERMKNGGLIPVLTVADGDMIANVDGKLLWRVFDNLFGNVCKYAQPGTRVYVSSEVVGDRIAVTFKNISGQALNISGEELTERFVRGDKSRNTEGSGLGLSISKSLTELMNGSFDVIVDGDLFKAVVTFDRVRTENDE